MTEIELKEAVLFAKYIKFRKNIIEIPARLIDKDEKDLEEKLEKSFKDIEDGNVYTLEEAYNKSKEMQKSLQNKKIYLLKTAMPIRRHCSFYKHQEQIIRKFVLKILIL